MQGVDLQIKSAPNLKMVGYLELDSYLLKLGSNLKKRIQQRFGSAEYTMRILGVAVGLDAYIPSSSTLRLLQCFRFVETLHIQLLAVKAPRIFLSSGFWETVECLDHHLTRVIFHQYRDWKSEREFARYLLLNGKVLKEMKFLVPKGCNEWAEMEKKLLGTRTTAPYGTLIIWQVLEVGGASYFPTNASNWSRVDPLMDRR